MTMTQQIAADVLRDGLDDWVPIDTLIWYAREASPKSDNSFKEVAIDVIGYLLSEGLAIAGDIGDDGFQEWAGSPADVTQRVVVKCESLNWQPYGGACWLSNTEKGRELVA
jgi:hypothetical protein